LSKNRTQLGQEAAKNIQQHAGDHWVVWYGRATGRFWAVCRGGWFRGLLEAASPLEMLSRIGEVDAWHGTAGFRSPRRAATGAWKAA